MEALEIDQATAKPDHTLVWLTRPGEEQRNGAAPGRAALTKGTGRVM